jgi:hypothetical protein
MYCQYQLKQFLELVIFLIHFVITRLYVHFMEYLYRFVFVWLNLTFLFVAHVTALLLVTVTSDCMLTVELERM